MGDPSKSTIEQQQAQLDHEISTLSSACNPNDPRLIRLRTLKHAIDAEVAYQRARRA
jgi:capsule polysaccharide export protein KpsE/RkpR